MNDLSAQDLRDLNRALIELYRSADLHRFPAILMGVIRGLVGCDSVAYEEINLSRQRTVGLMSPVEARPKRMDVFETFLHQHAPVQVLRRTRDGRRQPLSFFDVTRADDWRSTELHNEFYRLEGVDDQVSMVFSVSDDANDIAGVGINRSGSRFTDRDKLVLTALQPHAEAAYRNAAAMTDMEVAAEVSRLAKKGETGALILLDPAGRVDALTPAARALLMEAFPVSSRQIVQLPLAVQAWVGREIETMNSHAVNGTPTVPLPLRIAAADRQVEARLCRRSTAGFVVSLFTSRPDVPMAGPAGFALTDRQRDVLGSLLTGRSAKEVAASLGLSVHTVNDYTKVLYRRFGVTTRAELVATAKQLGF
jgi:DNA-binding CsgD family transcriptional regulator